MVLGIYGSGGSGREVKDIADMIGTWEEIIFIDDTVESGVFKGVKRMPFDCFCKTFDKKNSEVIVALGEPEYKKKLYKKVKDRDYSFANVIHPTAWISPSAKLGRGIIIKAGVIISCDAVVEDNVRIEPFAIIGHDCIVRESTQISPNVTMGGCSEIGAESYIGINVPIKENLKIGSNVVIGMGSVVLRDIPDNVIAMGNPARAMKHKDDSKVFK